MMCAIERRACRAPIVLATAALLVGCSGTDETPPAESRQPHLVIVIPDQWRGQALGFMNEDPVVTPTLDMFASQGLALTQAVVNYPVCSPSRAMLMTGRYPHANGVLSNSTSAAMPAVIRR